MVLPPSSQPRTSFVSSPLESQRIPSALAKGLGDRYAIEREIGEGAMATVYVARDLRHDRRVAVKVMKADFGAALGPERFLAEIRVTANLQHPNILPLHDSGHCEGTLYYVMPLIEGESLRSRLNRERRFPVDEALRLAKSIASALDYAHRKGIVHRDIKPENVLVTDGQPIIVDFGIARAFDVAGSDRLTMAGVAVGTPAYMSPEQAAGETDVDGRSDEYAVACILYEMLSGVAPFIDVTAQKTIFKHLMAPIPSVRDLRAEVPPAIDAAIQRALSKDPAERYATAADFVAALAAPDAAIAPPKRSEVTTLAVLPFANLSADRETDYFSDGMTDEIIGALSRIPKLKVSARTSTFALKGRQADIREAGRILNVKLVLEGSVRQAGDRLRVSSQLVDVATGDSLWSDRFERRLEDVFAIQDEIAAAIVDGLKMQLTTDEVARVSPSANRGTDNLEAYHLVLKGRHFWNNRALPKALECFQQAIALDPNYAQAYAGLADGLSFLAYYGVVPGEAVTTRAAAAARRAVEADPNLSEAHYSVALVELIAGHDFPLAEREFQRSLDLNPRIALTHASYAQLIAAFGRVKDFHRHGVQAVELEPLSPLIYGTIGWAHAFVDEARRGAEVAMQGLELDSNSIPCLWVAAACRTEIGDYDTAIELLSRVPEPTKQLPIILAHYGHALARAGRVDDARAILAASRQAPPPLGTGAAAWVHVGLGEIEQAMQLYGTPAAAKSPFTTLPLTLKRSGAEVRRDQRFAPLWDSFGFRELRVGRHALGL